MIFLMTRAVNLDLPLVALPGAPYAQVRPRGELHL